MAERKSGPVKPPVIELKARPAGKGPDASRPAAARAPRRLGARPKPEAPRPETPKPEGMEPIVATPQGSTAAEARKAEAPAPAETPKPAAREAERPASTEPASAAERARPAPEARPRPAPRPPSLWMPAIGAAAGGAVVAVAVCYALASAGFWPVDRSAGDARITALEARLAQGDKADAADLAALADVNTRLGGLETNFAAKLAAASSTLESVQGVVTKLQTAAKPPADLAPLQAQLKTLSGRVDAVAAGASSADAGAIAANIAALQQNLGDLAQKVAALDERAGTGDTALQNLKAELDSAKSAIDQAAAAPSPKTIASAMQLPLLISALDADFAAGRPYDTNLRNLVAAMPETHVPASVTDAAAAGLPAPEELAQAFEARVPDIIAARPASADSGWQGQARDWLTNVLALRQQGEQTGDSPDAVLSRLEAAVNRHDFAGAVALLRQLPPPMQAAAGDVATKLQALADAQGFVGGLRQTALAPAAGMQQ